MARTVPAPKRIPLGQPVFNIDPRRTPVAVVDPGTTVVAEVEDAFSGQIRSPGDRRDKSRVPTSNPMCGPILVRGAQSGDALVVTIDEIAPLSNRCATYPALAESAVEFLGPIPHEQPARICRIADGEVIWSDRVRLPYRPMLGVMGTTPEAGAPSSKAAGDHGGNLDLKEMTEGARVRLPVFTPGGLLYLGDCHAGQGDGEFSGAALEMAARVTLTIELDKGAELPGIRVETPDELIAVAVDADLRRAVVQALSRLTLWLESDFGWDRWEAYTLVTQTATLSFGHHGIGSVGAKIETKYAWGSA